MQVSTKNLYVITNGKMEDSALSFGVREQGCRFPFGGLFLSPAPMGNLPHPSDPMPRTWNHIPTEGTLLIRVVFWFRSLTLPGLPKFSQNLEPILGML